MQAYNNLKDIPYDGGGSIMIKGNLERGSSSSTQLFSGNVPLRDQSLFISYSVKFEGEPALGICLELSLATKAVVHALITDDEFPFRANHSKLVYDIFIKSEGINANASSATNAKWIPYTATMNSDTINSNGLTLTGNLRVSTTKEGIPFPSVKDWKVEGQYVSWSLPHVGTKSISLKLIWLLDEKEDRTCLFTKYNIYVEKLGFGTSYLGFARVEAFYVPDLVVPSKVSMIKFVIQPGGNDGSCQKLNDCPASVLNI